MKEVRKVKQITKVRKAVCAMANELCKAGYSLSAAFKKAWSRVKLSMTIRATGTTFENRQERLAFLKQFRPENLTVTLEREQGSADSCRGKVSWSEQSGIYGPAQ